MFALRSLDGQLELLNVFIAIVYQNPKVSNFQFEWTFYLLASIYLIFLITKLLFLKGKITASLRLVITISPFLLIYMYLLRFKNLDLKIGWMQKIWLVCLPLTRFFFSALINTALHLWRKKHQQIYYLHKHLRI